MKWFSLLAFILLAAGCSKREIRIKAPKVPPSKVCMHLKSEHREECLPEVAFTVQYWNEDLGPEETMKEAIRVAARRCAEYGFRYFVIDGETEDQMIHSDARWNGHMAYGNNFYNDLIYWKKFGRERLMGEYRTARAVKKVLGVRFTVQCYKHIPLFGGHDARDYVEN